MIDSPSPRPAVAASVIVVVGALTGASVWWGSAGVPLWLDVGAAVLGLGATIAQLWWPVSGALAATVLAAVSPAATPAATTGLLLAAQRNRFAVAAGVAAAGFGAHLVRGLWRPTSGISLGWWLLLISATYGALLGWGALARSRHALLLSLHDRAVRAEAEQGRRVAEARMAERRTLAREMHDVLAHRLSLVATHAGALEYRPDAPPEKIAKAAGVVRAGVHQALEELRDVIGLLREDDADAAPGPQPTLADLPRLIEEARDAGQTVEFRDEMSTDANTDAAALSDAAFPPTIGRAAYRVVQEGLTNARKHAPGRPVTVLLQGTPGTRLLIDISNPLPAEAAPTAEPSLLTRARASTSPTAPAQIPHALPPSSTATPQTSPPSPTPDTSRPSGTSATSRAPGTLATSATSATSGTLDASASGDPRSSDVSAASHTPHTSRTSGASTVPDVSRASDTSRTPDGRTSRAGGAEGGVPGSGVGLVGLTERVRLAGGQLDHVAGEGRFVLRAWLPWPA
ncbi:histidine kinase [Spirillospora sp. NPDC049652]